MVAVLSNKGSTPPGGPLRENSLMENESKPRLNLYTEFVADSFICRRQLSGKPAVEHKLEIDARATAPTIGPNREASIRHGYCTEFHGKFRATKNFAVPQFYF
jgi:hypothetical protein